MNVKQVISMLIIITLVAWVGHFVTNNPHEFDLIFQVSYGNLLGLLTICFFYLFLQGMIFNKALDAFDIKLSFREWFGLLAVTMLGNYIVPFAGIGIRAKYLKEKYQLTYQDFSISLAAIFLIEMLVFIAGGLIAAIYLYYYHYPLPLALLVFLLFGFLGICCMMFYPLRLDTYQARPIQKIDKVLKNWHAIKRKKRVVYDLFFYTTVLYFVSALMFYVAYQSFNFKVDYLALLLPTTLADLSFILRIAPGSLGTYDASIIYSSYIIGLTSAQGLLVVALIRVATMLWIFICGPIFSFLLFSKKKAKKFKSNSIA